VTTPGIFSPPLRSPDLRNPWALSGSGYPLGAPTKAQSMLVLDGWASHCLTFSLVLQDFCDSRIERLPRHLPRRRDCESTHRTAILGLMTQAIAGSRGLARNQWLTSPLSNVSHTSTHEETAWGTGTDSATYTPPNGSRADSPTRLRQSSIVRPMAMDANAFDHATWELSFVVAIA